MPSRPDACATRSSRRRPTVRRRTGRRRPFQEPKELLMTVPRVAGVSGDFPVATSSAANKGWCRCACSHSYAGGRPGPRQHRRAPVQRLYLAYLVHRHHDALAGGSGKPDNVADLQLQLRVGTELESLHPVRLEIPLAQMRHRANEMPSSAARNRLTSARCPPGRRPPVVLQGRHYHVNLIDHRRRTPPRLIFQCQRSRPEHNGPAIRSPSAAHRGRPGICAFGIPSAASSTILASFASPDGTYGAGPAQQVSTCLYPASAGQG